jgi:hypothetical protein
MGACLACLNDTHQQKEKPDGKGLFLESWARLNRTVYRQHQDASHQENPRLQDRSGVSYARRE